MKLMEQRGSFDTSAEGGDSGEVESFDNIDMENPFVEEVAPESEEEEDLQADGLPLQEDTRNEKVQDGDKEGDGKAEEEDEEAEESKEDSVPKPEGKGIRARLGDENLEVDESMEFIAKVDGKKERVTLRELIDGYSGKTAWDRKFTELGSEKKKFEEEYKGYKAERDQIVASVKEARAKIDAALQRSGDPREGINYLLDLMGYDTYNFNIALTDAMYGDISTLSQMSEAERSAYWANKELEYIKSRNGNLEKTRRAEQEKLAHRQQMDNIRQSHGVSEEAFNKAFNELVSKGQQNPYIMDVINQAKFASVADKAIELCTQYEEDLTSQELEDLEVKVADFLSKNPNYPIDQLKSYLDKEYKVGGAVKKLASKAKPMVNEVKVKPKQEGIESFDDLYNY